MCFRPALRSSCERKIPRLALDLLQAQNVRLVGGDERADAADAQAHRVDVPGRQLQLSHVEPQCRCGSGHGRRPAIASVNFISSEVRQSASRSSTALPGSGRHRLEHLAACCREVGWPQMKWRPVWGDWAPALDAHAPGGNRCGRLSSVRRGGTTDKSTSPALTRKIIAQSANSRTEDKKSSG